jgi:hypothetical protein
MGPGELVGDCSVEARRVSTVKKFAAGKPIFHNSFGLDRGILVL